MAESNLESITFSSFLAIYVAGIFLQFFQKSETAYSLMFISILLIFIYNIVLKGKQSVGNGKSGGFLSQIVSFLRILMGEASILLLSVAIYGQLSIYLSNKDIIEKKEVPSSFEGLALFFMLFSTAQMVLVYMNSQSPTKDPGLTIGNIIIGIVNLLITSIMYIQMTYFRTDG